MLLLRAQTQCEGDIMLKQHIDIYECSGNCRSLQILVKKNLESKTVFQAVALFLHPIIVFLDANTSAVSTINDELLLYAHCCRRNLHRQFCFENDCARTAHH